MKINFRILCLLSPMLATMQCHAQQIARQWNSEITAGWNLGSQFVNKTKISWANPLVTKRSINAICIPLRWPFHISIPFSMNISRIWMYRIKEVY